MIHTKEIINKLVPKRRKKNGEKNKIITKSLCRKYDCFTERF